METLQQHLHQKREWFCECSQAWQPTAILLSRHVMFKAPRSLEIFSGGIITLALELLYLYWVCHISNLNWILPFRRTTQCVKYTVELSIYILYIYYNNLLYNFAVFLHICKCCLQYKKHYYLMLVEYANILCCVSCILFWCYLLIFILLNMFVIYWWI